LNELFRYLPEKLILPLKAVSDYIEELVLQKEEAIADQDFDKAASLRDKAPKIDRHLIDAIKQVVACLRESDDEST
jgi:hypothetical protein